jgi:galactose oxidase-like protein/Big-like domain-containing protein
LDRSAPHLTRAALAASVGALCLVLAVGLVALLGPSGPQPARAQVAAVETPSDALPGHAHSGDLGVAGMTEMQLREFETATLGAEHAREHALMRKATREEAGAADGRGEVGGPKIAAAVDAAANDVGAPEDVGQWEAAKWNLPIVAIHAALLPTGKIMFFSYPTYPDRPNNAEAYLWDPAHPEQAPVLKNPPDKANIWCAGQTFTADGELLVFGGNLDYETASQTWKGLDRVFTFNPWTETWKEQPRMVHGRWYPTGVRLPDGRVPIMSGLDESGQLIPHSNTVQEVELFTPPAQPGGVGTIETIGSIGTGDDAERAQKPLGNLYPRQAVMADGHLYTAGPDQDQTWVLDDVDASPTFSWHPMADMTRHRVWGTTVPLPSGPGGPTKLLAIGGTQWSNEPSTTTTELFDINAPGAWQPQTGKDNFYGRGHANTVLLPDGWLAEVGGGRGSAPAMTPPFPSALHYAEPEQRHVELRNPDTGKWTLGPSQTEARAYHSTAVLLPDGRVMSAGDDYNGDPDQTANSDGPMEDTAEIYKPAYLFRGNRPTISSIPVDAGKLDVHGLPRIGFGDGFAVNTPNTNITRAALAAPAAVTHGVDMNQRMLELDVQQGDGCVSVTAPTGPNAAPPGYYMLYLLNDQGVPSVAKWLRLDQGGSLGGCGTTLPPDTTDPTVSLTAPAAGSTVEGTIDLRATAFDARGVNRVVFKVDGNTRATDTSSPYATTWSTVGATEGQHTITATAYDEAGNDATATALVTVHNTDTTAPDVSITSPAEGATVTGRTTVTANANDNGGSGVDKVQFWVDGDTPVGAADSTFPYSVPWDTINVENGNHPLTAEAYDKRGNHVGSAAVTVNVQNADGQVVNSLPPKKFPPTGTFTGGGGGGGQTGGGGGSGGSGGGGGGDTSGNVAPALKRLKLSATRFRLGKLTTISFRLSEAARVRISFERKLPGRRSGGRCVKPRRHAKANCTRYVRVSGGLTVNGKAGANSVGFRGRLSRKRALPTGSYRLTVLAKDSGGEWSTPLSAGFKLLASASTASTRAARAAVLAWF